MINYVNFIESEEKAPNNQQGSKKNLMFQQVLSAAELVDMDATD